MKKAVLAFLLSFSSLYATPLLTFPTEGVNFGEIEAGTEASHSIELHNHARFPVSISRAVGCCGAKATLSPMCIDPGCSATLTVSLRAAVPGSFSKYVIIECDKPKNQTVTIPVIGSAIDSGVSQSLSPRITILTIFLAGLTDGFNPCAFSIVIALAGILAVGGRKRKARVLGGLTFCIGSFLTYMAMGLGLLHVLRKLEGLRIVYESLMIVLSAVLFVLGFLSIRDAYSYRREKIPSAIKLQLPDFTKSLIRKVAEKCWCGPAVIIGGLGCGFIVTLLDSICTGQIYIPVIALISRNPTGALSSLTTLALYNLAFIMPLIAVFVLAAFGASSERMSHWSKRNVFPSKIAMGIVLIVLSVLLLPSFGGYLANLSH